VIYSEKKDYGQVPSYLHKIKQDVEEEKRLEELKNTPKPSLRKLTESERENMLQNLHESLESVKKSYGASPVVLNTISQLKL
jgi:hypothetical protein